MIAVAAEAVTPPAAKPSLKAQAVRGSMWQGVTLAVSQLLRLGSNIILARLLFPEVFGLSTLAMSISKGLNMFTDIGLGPNIIQNPRGDDPRFLNTAWTVQIVRALGLSLILALIAFPVARAYGEPRLFPILLALAAGALLNGTASTSIFSMNRHLEIGRFSMLNVGEQVCALAVTIAVAWVWPSVWAVVLGWFGGGIFRVAATHFYNRKTPHRFCWDEDALQSLVKFGRWIFVSTAILFLANQLDRLMLGRLAPMAQLGVYGMALGIASLPQQICSRITSFVLYPVLAKQVGEERPVFERKVLKARRSVLTAALVMMLGVALVSPAFFRYLYDRRYADAIWMAPLLCIYIWFSVLQSSADRALLALGDTRALAASNAVNVVVTIAGCLVGYKLAGMLGFVLGLSLSSLASHIVIEWSLSRNGIGIVLQDLRFTIMGLVVGAAGILGIHWVERNFGARSIWALAVPVLIMLAVSYWGFVVLKEEIFKKRKPVPAMAEPIGDAVAR